MAIPTYETFCNASKFFVDVKDEEGEKNGKMMCSLIRATVVVSIPCINGTVAKVAFIKSNRGRTFRDSRTPKKNITAKECLAELKRMLQSDWDAEQAFQSLQV